MHLQGSFSVLRVKSGTVRGKFLSLGSQTEHHCRRRTDSPEVPSEGRVQEEAEVPRKLQARSSLQEASSLPPKTNFPSRQG